MTTPLKITAHLASPVAGDIPHMDALLEFEMAQRLGLAGKIQRYEEPPPVGFVHIPMLRRTIGGQGVACCSSPIFVARSDSHEHVAKRLAVEHASLLQPKQRKVVATGNQVYKSYRLPLRLRTIDRIVWFAIAHRRPVLKLLKSAQAIGKKRSCGYGRIAKWEAEDCDEDVSWFSGGVLMRPLPLCDELPEMQGSRRDFGACQPPYWHPRRYMEIVVPC